MGRSGEYAMFVEEELRRQYEIPDDEEFDWDRFEAGDPAPGVFSWFRWRLEGSIAMWANREPEWDVFVSFASEHRADLVEPLVDALTARELRVWFDQDQVRSYADVAINNGLATTRVGVVIVSEEFFRKEYPIYELSGMLEAGVRGVIVVAYGLEPAGERVVERLARRLGRRRDVRYIRLRSTRTVGLARRIEAAVRRCSGPAVPPRPADDNTIAWVKNAFEGAQPDPAIVRRNERIRLLESGRSEIEDLVELGKMHPSDLAEIDDELRELYGCVD